MAKTALGVRVALIGCGGMGGSYRQAPGEHARALQRHGLRGHRRERARGHGEDRWGPDRHATDYRTVLDDVDAVFLVLPHHLHHPVGMECLRRGKHVLMEKPLANTRGASAST